MLHHCNDKKVNPTYATVALLFLLCSPIISWPQSPTSGQAQRKLKQQTSDKLLRKQRREEEQLRLQEVESEFKRNKTRRSAKAGKRQAKTAGPKFLVKRILISKSGVLLKDEVSEVLDKYQGQYLSITELQNIVYDLNRLYRGRKGSLSRALLPPQKIKDGTVRIILIESKMGKIIYESTKLTHLEYLKWVLPIAKDTITNIGDLEDMFIHFNRTHNSVKVSSRLRPGEDYSETDIIIQVTEVDRWNGSIFLDNDGDIASGQNRYGATLQSNSLLGIDDQFIAGGIISPGHTYSFATYSFPFTAYGTRFRGLYSKNNQNINDNNFSDLEIKGETTLWSGRATQPLLVNNFWKIDIGAEINQSDSSNTLSIFKLEHISKQYIAQINVKKYDAKGAWITGLNYHHSISRDLVNSTHSGQDTVNKWTGSLIRYQSITPQLSMVFRTSGQFATQYSLPPSEQFSLGGGNNLAYLSGEFSGDIGHAEEIEIRYRTYWEDHLPEFLQSSRIELKATLQHGAVISYLPDGERVSEKGNAQSLALGIEAQITSYVYSSITFAAPIAKDPTQNKQTQSLIFKLKLSF